MFTQFFGKYLINENIISTDELISALKTKSETKIKLGVLAINAGLMTSEQVEKIHSEQSKVDKRFGDIAVELGYASQEQIDELLNSQKSDYLLLGQALIDNKILSNSEFEAAIKAYKEKFALDENDFAQEQSNKTEKLIHHFFDFSGVENSELYVKYIDLLLKNLIRFVGDDFTPIKADIQDLRCSDDLKHCSLTKQNIVNVDGSFQTSSILAGNNSALIDFSSRYSGENITEFDELAKAGLCDFLNLHNGLYTVNISKNNGIELTLTPPETKEFSLENNIRVLTMQICYPFGSVYISLTF